MSMIRKLLGTAPTPTAEGTFEPSPLALKLAVQPKTDYDGGEYSNPYKGGDLRVLMVCTEERDMLMKNGTLFSTGNHPVEMGLPMLHMIQAGFHIDVVTPTGQSVKIEEWAMPSQDENMQSLFQEFADAFKNPGSLADFVANSMNDASPYAAVFVPGGHGAMLGLPENADLAKLLKWAHRTDRLTMAICHGPATFVAANDADGFIYDGYEMTVFPDAVDKQTPMIGYLPGHMPWEFGKKLTDLGVTIVNKKADDSCHRDRNLITGASPKASNAFGRLAAKSLLGVAHTQTKVQNPN